MGQEVGNVGKLGCLLAQEADERDRISNGVRAGFVFGGVEFGIDCRLS